MSMTDPHLKTKGALHAGHGVKQDHAGSPAGQDEKPTTTITQQRSKSGTVRPPGMGTAGGSPGNGAKGSGTLIAQGKVVGSGSHSGTNSAGPEGKSKVDMSPVGGQGKHQTGPQTPPAESNTLPGFPGGTYD